MKWLGPVAAQLRAHSLIKLQQRRAGARAEQDPSGLLEISLE